MKTYLNLAAAAAIALGGAGCGKSASDKAAEVAVEQAAKEQGQDVDVKVDSSKGTFQMTQTTDGGKTTASYGEGSKVPADFPKDVPLYEGLNVLMAQSTPSEGQYVVTATIAAPLDKVAAFYKEKLAAGGWKVETSMSIPGQTDTNIYSKDGRTLSITIAVEGSETTLMISVAKNS